MAYHTGLLTRLFAIVLLLLLVVFSWYAAYDLYREHKKDITLELQEIITALALPFYVAELLAKEPVTELPVPLQKVRTQDIVDTWNEARTGGRVHEGVDIFAERGEPVFSATEGYVTLELKPCKA